MTIACLILFIGMAVPVGHAGTVTLEWDRNPEPDVNQYKVYLGTKSGEYNLTFLSNNKTELSLPVEDGITYYSVVTAINTSNMESVYSNEISFKSTKPNLTQRLKKIESNLDKALNYFKK